MSHTLAALGSTPLARESYWIGPSATPDRSEPAVNRRLIAVASVALVLAGCARSGSSAGSSSGYDTVQVGPGVAVDGGKSSTETGTASSTTPSVIRTGDMTLNTADVSGTYDKVKSAVLAAGGRIESASYYAGGNGTQPSGQVIARIPESKLDAAITQISTLGQRTALNVTSTDVTMQRKDLEAQLTALTASRDRLQALMAKAANLSDLLAAEKELTTRQAELDSLTSQLAYLKGQVDESTLSITVTTDRTGITAGLRSWGELFRQGLHAFLSSLQAVVVWTVTVLPWAALLGVIATMIAALRRRRRT